MGALAFMNKAIHDEQAGIPSIKDALSKDHRFYCSLRFPEREPASASCAGTFFYSKSMIILAAQRIAHGLDRYCAKNLRERLIKKIFRVIEGIGKYLTRVVIKSDYDPSSEIEAGIYLSGRGHIILGVKSIGSGTIVFDHVTFGRSSYDQGIPEIGRNVFIGPNCVISGNIQLGDGSTLLANSVLTKSLPPGAAAQGNPARILEKCFDNSILRQNLYHEGRLTGAERLQSLRGMDHV